MKKRMIVSLVFALSVLTVPVFANELSAENSTGIEKEHTAFEISNGDGNDAASDTNNATLNHAQVRFHNGEIQTIQCYNINGYNFVRIRDIMNHLDMAVSAIQDDHKGVVIDPYDTPTSKEPLEALTQQTAKVKVERGELIYGDSGSEAECFLLNGRYYFKLADIENATNKAWGSMILNHQVVGMAIDNGNVFEKFPRIDITWNDAEKMIEVNIMEADIQKIVRNFLEKTTENDSCAGKQYDFDADFICIQQRADFTYILNEADIHLVLDELAGLLNRGEILESSGKDVLRPTANFVYRIVWVTDEEIKDFSIYKTGRVYEHISDSEGRDIAVSNTEADAFLKMVDKLFENSHRISDVG